MKDKMTIIMPNFLIEINILPLFYLFFNFKLLFLHHEDIIRNSNKGR